MEAIESVYGVSCIEKPHMYGWVSCFYVHKCVVP